MPEPTRIGLTEPTRDCLLEMIKEGIADNNWDLYKLAVALEISEGNSPPPLPEKANGMFRTYELDPDSVLCAAVENMNLVKDNEATYSVVERLGEVGVKKLYEEYKSTGSISLDKLLVNID